MDANILDSYKFVKSGFRSAWKGIVLNEKTRSGGSSLCIVLVLKDKNGNFPRKRIFHVISSGWLIKIDKFDVPNFNKDWLINLPNYVSRNFNLG